LHYLLPFLIFGLIILHIWALHIPGNNNPVGIDVKKNSNETMPFHPYMVMKDITALCSHLKCPKDYQQIAELVSKWYIFSKDLLSHTAQEVLDFYLKTDSLRRQRRFEKILIAFKELGIDVKPISEILVALKTINVSKLDKALIVEQIAQKRLSVIGRFLNPTK